MPFTDSAKNEMLDAQGARYAALFTGDPSGAGTEETGTNYARIQVTYNAAASGARANSNEVKFDNGGASDWSNAVDYVAFYDAATAGNLMGYKALSAARDMSIAGATLTFAIGDIDETLT